MNPILRRPRGGAFNSAGRESYALTIGQVKGLIAATKHATAIGLPFTRMITIHWVMAGIALADMAKATGQFLDKLTKLLVRNDSKTAWIWVHENGQDKGGHCHILVHVPAAQVGLVARHQKGWIKSISDLPYKAKTIHSRPIGTSLGIEKNNTDLWLVNLEVALDYVLKGADRYAINAYGLRKVEAGGFIIGKRCGNSQNTGPKARKEADQLALFTM